MLSFKNSFVALVATTALVWGAMSCNSQASKEESNPAKASVPATASTLKVAYVNLDSVYNHYDYYKDVTDKLNKTAEANQNQLAGKMRAMQTAAQAYQAKLQKNQIASREAAEAEERKLAQMQQEGQQLEMRLTEQFAKQQQEANNELFKTVKAEIEKMNKELKYDFIFTNTGLQNMFYANPAYDITDQVIKHLNEAYADKKKEDSKK